MRLMKHEDYVAKITYDADEEVFRGEVLNIKDFVDFAGSSVDELKKEFARSVEIYLETCEKHGLEPGKSFSGRFNVRLKPEQHQAVALAAAESGRSLNDWVALVLEEQARKQLEG